jgi:hypothetical protein
MKTMEKGKREDRGKSDETPLQQPLPPFLFPKNTPVTVTMGGGYARNLSGTLDLHVQTVKFATEAIQEFRECHPLEKRNYMPSSCQAEVGGWQHLCWAV